ncbi:MAG: phasin family protein [Tardiphaga sp.]
MPTIDETKPAGKPAKRKAERKKKPGALKQAPAPVILRTAEPVEAQSHIQVPQPLPELPPAESVVIDPPEVAEVKGVEAAAPEPATAKTPAAETPAAEPAERTEAAAETSPVAPAEPVVAAPVMAEPAPTAAPSPAEPIADKPTPAEPVAVNMQTIANAYRDYTRKSFEAFGSYVEQLSGARSFDKAMSVQREFMKRSYETSVAETQKICDLHARLARQNLDPFRGLAGKAPQTPRKP